MAPAPAPLPRAAPRTAVPSLVRAQLPVLKCWLMRQRWRPPQQLAACRPHAPPTPAVAPHPRSVCCVPCCLPPYPHRSRHHFLEPDLWRPRRHAAGLRHQRGCAGQCLRRPRLWTEQPATLRRWRSGLAGLPFTRGTHRAPTPCSILCRHHSSAGPYANFVGSYTGNTCASMGWLIRALPTSGLQAANLYAAQLAERQRRGEY